MAIYFNGSEVTGTVYMNGTEMDSVIANGTTVWENCPCTEGATLIDYSWSPGNNISNFISTYGSLGIYDTTPYFSQGSGSPDSRITFSLLPGYQVTYYNQSEHGTCSGTSCASCGGTHVIYVGHTVTGLQGASLGASGNGGSRFKVTCTCCS